MRAGGAVQRAHRSGLSRNRRCSGYTARPGPARGDTSRPGRSVGWYAPRSTAPNTAPRPHRDRNRTENGSGAVSGKTITPPVHHSAMPAEKEQTHTHSAIPAARWAGKNASGPALQRPANCRAGLSKHLHGAPQTGPYAHPRSAALPWRLAPIVGRPTEIPARGPRPEGAPVIT